MELLILLAAKNGQLVTRTEIAERLWEREVFVDTEHGINTAVRKIRLVLRDNPEQPRFVQTVTGRGYRFIGPIVEVRPSPAQNSAAPVDAAAALAPPSAVPTQGPVANRELPGNGKTWYSRNARLLVWLAVLGALTAVAFLIIAIRLDARGWGDRFLNRAARPKISSLAVLPLDNLSGVPGQDYIADGMTDELITMLAKNSTLRIISRTSVMQYKGARRPLPQIARELGVNGVLEGSVARSGDKVHMTIQLIEAPSDTHVWAESYDRDANNLVSLPREAAQTIAKQLHSAVLQVPPARFVSPEAHDAYLRGRYLWFTGHNDLSGDYFKRATELQPDYASGWSGLSIFYSAGAIIGELNPEESLAPAEAAAIKAVALDDTLPEAHLALSAAIFTHRWDWARAEQEIARAIELDPKFAEAYHFRAKIFTALNRDEEAIEAQKKATELDPFTRPWAMTLSLLLARQYDAALNEARQRLEGNPQDPKLHWFIYDIYRGKGMEKEAAQALEQLLLPGADKVSAAGVRRAFQQGGYKALVRWQLSDLKKESSTQYVSPVDLATLNAQLGRREEAPALLEEGYRQHSPLLLRVQNEPAFDFLHFDERYRSIIRGTGLPPTY